jgi:hypothetical protein
MHFSGDSAEVARTQCQIWQQQIISHFSLQLPDALKNTNLNIKILYF